METEVLENPSIEDIRFAIASMWERNFILYKTVKTDNLVVLYFKIDKAESV